MKIVKVRKEDKEVIGSIGNQFFQDADVPPSLDHLDKLLADDRTYLFAAIIDGVVVGYALAYRFPSLYTSDYLAYLYDIEVLANYRRKGAGRLLMETLLAQLKTDGVSELWLGTATDNIEGQGLISSTGAIKSGETFNDYTYDLS